MKAGDKVIVVHQSWTGGIDFATGEVASVAPQTITTTETRFYRKRHSKADVVAYSQKAWDSLTALAEAMAAESERHSQARASHRDLLKGILSS